ncbi:hypothetical protein BDFB_007339 [Asbolus verrucosus]|uniref:Uncharacterized protein n=1 Tax=Asbolus verrucosus TaxID=1661398 RepID=A0A482W1K7_ASBVE|nr:hypothetical protein BDFB_007339 [Asbolus verrucosus]
MVCGNTQFKPVLLNSVNNSDA